MTTSKRRIPINNHEPVERAAGISSAAAGEAGAPADLRVAAETQAAKGQTAEAQASGARATEAPTAVAEAAVAQAAALEEALRTRDALADSLLRLRADFDNFRKRAARELIEARDRAQGELLGDLLPVLDNLERALDAAEHHDEGKVLGGVRMTRDMFVDLLRRSGVEEIETVGAHFDPRVHDAMLMQPSDGEEGIVTAVLERGYRQGDRILRPARVAVSSGPGDSGKPGVAG
jgi:molecular chaperone GrpE